MASKKLWADLKKHQGQITGAIHHFYTHHDPKTIHAFRLQVKKIKAAMRMLTAEHPSKLPATIREIYHLAGTYRDTQLLHHTISKISEKLLLQPPEAYLNKLDSQKKDALLLLTIKSRTGKWHTRKMFHAIQQKSKQTHLAHPEKEWLNLQLKQIKPSRIIAFTDRQLHESRKRWKDIQYNWEHMNKPHNMLYQLKKKQIAELTDQLGQHHDICMALEKISTDLPAIQNQQESTTLKMILEELHIEKDLSAKHCTQLINQITRTVNENS